MTISVKVPASTANVGPGYDVFGIALSLYNTISIKQSDKLMVNITGPKADQSLPEDDTNLVYQAIQAYYKYIDKPCPDFYITIDCQIPLASGLGSSSTAIAGGLAAANRFEGDKLNTDELLTLAWKVEGHPDNVAPAILGGFVISAVVSDDKLLYKKLDWPQKWKIIISHPDFKLSTQEARAILPEEVPLKDAIYNMSCCSFLVAAVCSEDSISLKSALKDKLHQPYRSKLVPGMQKIITTLEETSVSGTVLSGAGPSICIITEDNNTDEVVATISKIWKQEGIESEFFFPCVDNKGIHFI